eukprot:TRINITY_DN2319_c0_g1_i1.p1 TRINITY_DN2319_c0_g1~~TRINITY_DN2319_c0_g1_i1.p1  ORF type:complete len:175 (-),score=35.98 TRINITY_DN2319_c0_g1_i1:184-708(-)
MCIRDSSIINSYYKEAKRKYIRTLADWAKKPLQKDPDKIGVRTELVNKGNLEDAAKKSQFYPRDRKDSGIFTQFERRQSLQAKLKIQSSFKTAIEGTPKSSSLFKKYSRMKAQSDMELGASSSKLDTPKSTASGNSSRSIAPAKKEMTKPVFKYCPGNEELADLILNAKVCNCD